MENVSLPALFAALVFFLMLVAFFSGSEVALLSINRYRLRHRAELGSRGARMTEDLLKRPDQWIGVNLLLLTVANVLAPIVVTLIAQRLGGGPALAIGAGALAFVILVFCELAPKTYAVLHNEQLAVPSGVIHYILLKIFLFRWIVVAVNVFANGLLRVLGVSPEQSHSRSLSDEELRVVVAEAGALMPKRRHGMLMSILDLENITVNDIMIPRTEVTGIDIADDWDQILEQLRQAQHTRIPLYEGELDQLIGLLHMKNVARELARGKLTRELLIEIARAREAYFVPEGTTLNTQLLNFQRNRRRMAFVVDEYGDVQGLVTLEDILEEIVGEFTTDTASLMHKDVHQAPDGSFVINASATVRALNRAMHWTLPTDGPKTLNGLIVEHLQSIPSPGTALRIGDYAIEVMQTADNVAKTVRLRAIPRHESRDSD